MNEALQRKIKYSVDLIKKAEPLALTYDERGFHLAFSGGKDSQVLYELAVIAGVKFHAEMQVTTVDPPELMKFIRKYYPDVTLNRPEINMYELIKKKKMLPLRNARYCCEYLKEQSGAGTVTILGIRTAESVKRSKRNEVEISRLKFSGTIDQFNSYSETRVSCLSGKDKLMISPILKWTNNDVWSFIRSKKLPYCSLYDEGRSRIGCIFCPMATKKSKEMDLLKYPKVAKAYKKSIQYLIDNYGYGNLYSMTSDEIFSCWIRNKNFESVVGSRMQLTLPYNNNINYDQENNF